MEDGGREGYLYINKGQTASASVAKADPSSTMLIESGGWTGAGRSGKLSWHESLLGPLLLDYLRHGFARLTSALVQTGC